MIFNEKYTQFIENGWKNDAEAHELLDLIVAEFNSDPMSVQCFDMRIVKRAQLCVAKRKAYIGNKEFGIGRQGG